LLDGILAFDRAESSTANLTQTNLIAVSSFCGINGLVWGYDLAKQPLRRHPLLPEEQFPQAYDLTPLLEATQALLGTVREPRFPVAPGEHLVCAYKSHTALGPCRLYGAMAIGIASERDRHADLFMEDHGTLADADDEALVLGNLLRSVAGIGENLGVRYEMVFVGLRSCWVAGGRVGCALTAAPYLHLARAAVPDHEVGALEGISLARWQASVLGL
jgi:histidine decarboxylase